MSSPATPTTPAFSFAKEFDKADGNVKPGERPPETAEETQYKKYIGSPLAASLVPRTPNIGDITADETERFVRAFQARMTNGISPSSVMAAYNDWLIHLAGMPAKRNRLTRKWAEDMYRLSSYAFLSSTRFGLPPLTSPSADDKRFVSPEWAKWPYNLMAQSFLTMESWWNEATTDVHGVTKQHEHLVNFTMRQILDRVAPCNFPALNPEVMKKTLETGGNNLLKGWQHATADFGHVLRNEQPEGTDDFVVGVNVAAMPGKVVYRNRLLELIQYEPKTKSVQAEPVLVIPSWLMKYYILDLSADNSMVGHLLSEGHTVFMISWRNPTKEEADLTFEDYRVHGVMAALTAVSTIVHQRKVHLCGYWHGGLLAALTAAVLGRDGDTRVASLSLLTTQLDFTELGELMMYVNESQLAYLEDLMWAQGYLDRRQVAGGLQILRSNDLVWSRTLRQYLLGETLRASDLTVWNSDRMRLPALMHIEFLRKIVLENQLMQGALVANDAPVSLANIRVPVFVMAATKDHIVPWRASYKLHLQADTNITFVLTSGGHASGLISPPTQSGKSFQIFTQRDYQTYLDPDTWQQIAEFKEGSWWPTWSAWLTQHSSADALPPPMGHEEGGYAPITPAPGAYVMER
jgi:polyhydroxyalkanoate synthase subunit PhaC